MHDTWQAACCFGLAIAGRNTDRVFILRKESTRVLNEMSAETRLVSNGAFPSRSGRCTLDCS